MGALTLITGGARAGKTAFALSLARAHPGPVTYVATAEAGDREMAARIERHRRERPAAWRTVEEPLDPAAALRDRRSDELILFDCMTLWVSNLLLQRLTGDGFTTAEAKVALDSTLAALDGLLDWRDHAGAALVVVSNEVGWGIVPASPLARLYRDALGSANQRVAARADRVYLVTAGLALELRAAGAVPIEASNDGKRG